MHSLVCECVLSSVCLFKGLCCTVGSSPRLEGNPLPRVYPTGNVRNKSIMMMHALCWRHVRVFKEYLRLADVPEPCFCNIRVQFMMIGRLLLTHTHTHIFPQSCTHIHSHQHTHVKPWRQGQISKLFEGAIIHHANAIIGFIIWWEFQQY